MPYFPVIEELAASELEELRAYDERRIVAAIDEQLVHQPLIPARNRKPLGEIPAGFEYVPPLWELRVGDFRVFYDVNEEESTVHVRAVRKKARGQRTEDIV